MASISPSPTQIKLKTNYKFVWVVGTWFNNQMNKKLPFSSTAFATKFSEKPAPTKWRNNVEEGPEEELALRPKK